MANALPKREQSVSLMNNGASSLEAVKRRFRAEFVKGSRINPELFESAVTVVPDILELPGGDIETPIHDALNWRYTRFGHTARETVYAALLQNEDGSTWQAKLSKPRHDAAKDKPIKYETPSGVGSRLYLPPVPAAIRKKISLRYNIRVPMTGSFWKWLERRQRIPIIWTEGGKKALSLLSKGYVAISLYGVNGGYRKQIDDSRVLIDDVKRFARFGRPHYLAFDQDETAATKRKVSIAINRFAALLENTNGIVSVIEWDSSLGKGVDDLIVRHGISAFQKAYTEAYFIHHWRILQRLAKQLSYPLSLKLETKDLSSVETPFLPESGIIAIASPKGTGKTKFIRSITENSNKVLSATHRIALGRNLCSRLGLSWRGDIEKVAGHFIAEGTYTLRVGFCVDSFLSIDPRQFEGCDLVLDEVVQVVRHLLTSSTCSREGKRPALLARFTELLRVAKRVICADADLDNGTLHYLQALRGTEEPVHLIRNQYEPEGYPCLFIKSTTRTAITAHLIEAAQNLEAGKTIFVATDSKTISKCVSALLLHEMPELRILVINSETSGGELEREFMASPDKALKASLYDVIICSPSMATGVSIEAGGAISAVYGIFMGVSSTDADMAQSLSRVREPVQRVVWCSRVGRNYSKVSKSSNFLEVKSHLQQKTSAVVRLVREGLHVDTAAALDQYNWQENPHLNLYCQISAAQNYAMGNLRDALFVRLRYEGNTVTVEEHENNTEIEKLLRDVRAKEKRYAAQALVKAEDISYSEILLLEQKEVTTPEENLAIEKHYFKEFYCLDALTVEDVLWDNEGKRRAEILALEVQLYPELARERTIKAIEKQASWENGLAPWDIPTMELKRVLREHLRLPELIQKMASGWQWTAYDLAPYAAVARQLSEQIKVALQFTIHNRVGDVQIIHQLLRQLGIKTKSRWSRAVPGYEGNKIRVYTLDSLDYEYVMSVLERRRMKRESFEQSGSPSVSNTSYGGGAPTPAKNENVDTPLVSDQMGVEGEERGECLSHIPEEQFEVLPDDGEEIFEE